MQIKCYIFSLGMFRESPKAIFSALKTKRLAY